MDGMLPPVDTGGWLDYQRRRAQQYARERIARAGQIGQVGGDWLSRAGSSLDSLIPDWAKEEAPRPNLPQITPLPSPSLSEGNSGVLPDWARSASDRIGQIGSDLGSGVSGVIDRAQGIITPAADAVGAKLAQPDAPDPWGPASQRAPGVPNLSEWAGQGLRQQGQTMVDTAERDAELTGFGSFAPPGAAGLRRTAGTALIGAGNALGNVASQVKQAETGLPPELGGTGAAGAIDYPTVAGGVLGGAGAGNPYSLIGSTVHGGAIGAGAPEPVASAAGFVPEVLAPNTLVDDVFGLVLKGGMRVAKPAVAKAVEAIGAETAVRMLRESPQRLVELVRDAADRYGFRPEVGMGVRAGGAPVGPSAPGAGMTSERIAERVRQAEDALYTWQAGTTPEYDYVARLLRPAADGTPSRWAQMVETGRLDPDALNRALVAYREEGLSLGDALQRALGPPEAQAANLEIGAAAGGVRQPSGLTKKLFGEAITDLTENGRPFVSKSEGGAFKAGRNEPPNPAGKKHAWEYVDKNGRSQWLSTPYEVLFAKQLDANPNVAYWTQSSPEAVMETTVRHGGEPKVFTPDFVIVGTDGRIQVVEIKNVGAFRQVPWRVPEKLREAEEFFNSKGIGFSIFAEDQLGRVASKGARPDDFLPDASGRRGVVNGFFVENEEGVKAGRFDAVAAREELAKRLREAGGSWELKEAGYLSGFHPVTQEEYDELLASERWPKWSGRMERGRIGRPDRRNAPITPDQRRKIIAAGVGGSHPAEGGYGRPYRFAEPLLPEQGGYDPRWTPHRAFAEFNERQRRKGAPSIAVDAVEVYPQMLQRVPRVREEWAKQVADGQHGLTVDPHTGQVGVPGRYAVSIAPNAGLELPGKPEDIHPDQLALWMAEMSPMLREIPNARVGFWYDSTKDTTYVDVSIGLDDLRQAEELGKRLSQYAIFDSVTKKDIDLVYPGYAPKTVPPPPSKQEQRDALAEFSDQGFRPEPGRAGAAGAGAGAVRGGDDGVPGAALGGQVGRAAGGVPGAEAPGYAGAAGSGPAGLGDLESGLGGLSYPVPVDGATPVPGGTVPGFGATAGTPGAAGEDGVSGALQRALASIQPYGAAATQGERAFDIAAGTAGGVAGAATADEDATWQERAKRFAMGSAGAALAGPTARGALGQLAGRSADTLGATAGQRARRAQRAAAQDAGKVKLSDIPTILGSVPLMAPSSLGANFTGGMARSIERVAGQAFELRPVDAATDLLAMLREIPGAASRMKANTLRGPTEAAQGAMGAPVAGDLSTRGGKLPGLLTSGVRVNSATDQFWRDLNEAGARAVAGRRGLGTAQTNRFATKAGDYATFTGTNSIVATKLTEMKRALRDPNANAGDKAIAGIVTAMAPYIMMPERLLRATVLAPVEQAVGFGAALKRGDKAAAREAAGRLGAGMGALFLMKTMYDRKQLTGDPPQDANERRRREAQGEQWNSFDIPGVGKVPTRYFGSLGMQANMVASVMDAAARAEAKGADPGAVWEARANELAGWSLDNSYLSDLTDFATAVSERRFGDAARQTLAGTLARPIPIVPGMANAADPYERQTEDFPSTLAARTGLRALAPTRIDPVTGEDQRRRGSGLSRYFGERGSEMTPEATELARLGLQPRVLGRTEEYEGAKQTPEQRRIAQRASGSETGRAVRAALASPSYQGATDAEKKSLLQAALREAAKAADIKTGEQVSRSSAQQAQRAWDAIPKYQGVDGTPDEIRKQNAAIATAKAAQAAAKKRGDAALDRWERENPAQADLAATKPANSRYLTLDKEEIETKYGVALP